MRTNRLALTCRRSHCKAPYLSCDAIGTVDMRARASSTARLSTLGPTRAVIYQSSGLGASRYRNAEAHLRDCQQPSLPVYAHKLPPDSLAEPLTREFDSARLRLRAYHLSRVMSVRAAHVSDLDQAIQPSPSGAPFMRINCLAEWPTRRASATSSLKYKYRPVEFQRSKTGVKIGRRNHCSHSTKRRCRQKHDRHASRCRIP